MKKIFSLLFAILIIVSTFTVGVSADSLSELTYDVSLLEDESYEAPKTGITINVYNWGEYIADGTDDSIDINAEFTRLTGIEVNYTTFDSNESLYSKLVGGGANYDVIIPSDYMVAKLADEGMLAELNFDNIPNFQYIDEDFVNPDYDTENLYSVPYTWGLVGLFYNKDYIEEVPTSWEILWDEEYAGKILMFDNPRDAFAIAQMILGTSLNSEDSDDWIEAAMLLKEQKDLVQAYVMDQIFDKMESGEAWLAPYYSGDAAILVEENDNIGFIFPEEGTNYFVDAMCIPVTSENQEAAEAYINFMCDPVIAAANMDYVGYASPESAAKEYMDEEIINNEMYYPSEETISKSEVFTNPSDDISELIDTLWAEVKMGGPGDAGTLIAIILVFLGIYIGIIIYKKRKRQREM